MQLAQKKVLVTGADGFIGSHLVEALVRANSDVRAFVYYNAFGTHGWLEHVPASVKKEIDVVSGDIRDFTMVKKAMRGCEVVFHLAALVGIPYSYESPDAYVDTNIKGTLHVLQAARDFSIEKVIQTSTSEVYGSALYVPIPEEHPLCAQSPYAASKIGADQLALSFYRAFGTPVAVIRPFNTYGPRQSLRAVIPTVIAQIASGQRQLKLGAMHPTRDFNYIRDTVRGFVAMAEADHSVGEVINIGSNYEISIGDLVALISDEMNTEVEVQTEQLRLRPSKSEVERLWADNQKAQRLLGWKPEYAGIEGLRKGIRETVDWFTKEANLGVYKPQIYNI